jgi:phosphatidylglycerophosphate synthase
LLYLVSLFVPESLYGKSRAGESRLSPPVPSLDESLYTPGRHAREGAAAIEYNTWIHRFVRVLIRPLARTPVTPNQLTTLRLITGIAAALGYGTGEAQWIVWASAVFVVSVLLDRADGELARLTGQTSEAGHSYDIKVDAVCNTAVLIGVGVGLRHSVLGMWAIPMGVAAGLSVAVIASLVIQFERDKGARSFHVRGLGGFDPDDAILIIPLAMVLGGGVPLMVVATVAAPLVAIVFIFAYRRRTR